MTTDKCLYILIKIDGLSWNKLYSITGQYSVCVCFLLQNNHLDKMNEPVYMITLKTEAGDQQGVKNIQFSCSIEQLQVGFVSSSFLVNGNSL